MPIVQVCTRTSNFRRLQLQSISEWQSWNADHIVHKQGIVHKVTWEMAQGLCFQQLLNIYFCEQDFQGVEFLTQRQKHQLGQSMPGLSGEKDLEAICILSPF